MAERRRARPICEDDLYRVDTPAGESCLYCPDPIVDGDRGVVMGSTPDIPGGFSLRLNGGWDDLDAYASSQGAWYDPECSLRDAQAVCC